MKREENAKRSNEGTEFDQIDGYVRPSILILASYRHEFFDIVNRLLNLTDAKLKSSVKKKINDNFTTENKALNQNFCFSLRLGKILEISKSLFEGDIIIASPSSLLDLGEETQSLLSSLHTLFLYNSENFEIQNIESLISVLKMMNQQPLHKYITQDFRAISPIFFENKSLFFRQSIAVSSYNTNKLHAVISRYFSNFKGIFRSRMFNPGIAHSLPWKMRFYKFNTSNSHQELIEKLNYFENVLWDYLRNQPNFSRALIHTNDYFEYQRIKKILKDKKAPVICVSEHATAPKAQSAMAKFSNKRCEYILSTERAILFDVIKPKSFQAIIFYSLPFNPEVMEKLSQIQSVSNVFVFFGSQAYFELETLVGSLKASEFVSSTNKYKEFRI